MKLLVLAVLCLLAINQAKATGVCKCTECIGTMELGFVWDSSSSISEAHFNKGRKFLKDFVSTFQIGPKATRVSIVTYGLDVHSDDAIPLNRTSTKAALLNVIGNITHRHETYTNTGDAIEYMRKWQLNTASVRTGLKRVAVIVTDGNSQDTQKTKRKARAARRSGITMFAVGVGSVRQRELKNIAGNKNRVNHVSSYDRLSDLTLRLTKETCETSDLRFDERPTSG